MWRFDVFRQPTDGDTLICLPDPSIRRPYREVFEMSADGIPYLRPEICLLFKAKAVRDKDRADFKAALPRMSPGQRAWLRTALERVHRNHESQPDPREAEKPQSQKKASPGVEIGMMPEGEGSSFEPEEDPDSQS